jgi:hypothetical protein
MNSDQSTWKDLIPGCFGIADLKFARHPLDEQRAKNMVNSARDSGSSTEEILGAIREYLTSEEASSEHINHEIEYVRKFLA